MPKKKVRKTTKKTTTPTPPVEETSTVDEGQKDFLPDFKEGPNIVDLLKAVEKDPEGCVPKPLPEAPAYDPLPSFGEGPRRTPQFLDPHPVTSVEKEAHQHARAEQENFWIKAVVAQNAKKPHSLIWLEAKREYQNRRVGPVQNWPPDIVVLVEQKFRSLLEDPNFLRPLVRFQIRINNSPQVMPMTLWATYAATVEALRLVLEENFEEL